MEKNVSESGKENVVIWQIQFDHLFHLHKNEIHFMLFQNLYKF